MATEPRESVDNKNKYVLDEFLLLLDFSPLFFFLEGSHSPFPALAVTLRILMSFTRGSFSFPVRTERLDFSFVIFSSPSSHYRVQPPSTSQFRPLNPKLTDWTHYPSIPPKSLGAKGDCVSRFHQRVPERGAPAIERIRGENPYRLGISTPDMVPYLSRRTKERTSLAFINPSAMMVILPNIGMATIKILVA